ncbi:reverse transcriptase domain-containing protein [Tanacetum coccineum]|uniref:Reverse transcriptase domain-containing protein n=1 Tax=Tanacetum coccineum TaxID=301880 RepID=A0ABQ5DSX0_9ASTR
MCRRYISYRDQRLSISEEALGAFSKSQTYRGKEVNMAAGDSADALVCCVENTVEDCIMDSDSSFHVTYCKEELERLKLRSGLKRRLISVGQLDEEGYHVGFEYQQWKVTKGSLVVAYGNKRGILYMVEVHPEGIDAIINGSGSAAVEAEEAFLHDVSEDKETTETTTGVANGIVMLKMVPETPLQFGVAERLRRTFRAESTELRTEAPKMLWAVSVSTSYLIYRIPYVPIGLRIPEEEWREKDTSLAHLKVFGCDSFVKVKDVYGEAMKCTFIGSVLDEMRYSFRDTKSYQVIRSRDITFVDSIYEARSATDSSNLTKPIEKSQVVLVDDDVPSSPGSKASPLKPEWDLLPITTCNHPKNPSISSKPDRAHICTISGAIYGTATISPIRNGDLRTELEYFSEDYDEEREMEPRTEPRRESTPTLWLRSLGVRRQRERVVGFEDVPNREGNMRGRNAEGIRPSEIEAREGENRRANLPPLLAAHLGRNKNSHPLRSSLTSVQGGHQPSTNMGETSLLTIRFSCTMLSLSYLIEDYPLPNKLKMPSHIGSYDRKGDPDNFLHLFQGAIRMQKWLMPVACHMFTYTLKDSARIWWNSQKIGSILNYEDLKAKFRSYFSQQKKFTKTHLAVYNIKQREGESTRAFITRYTENTLQILGLHEEQGISGFVYGLRTRSLVEHLSTDLPSIYKGLMEKTYTWVEAREVATNGDSNDRRDSFKRSKKSSWDNNRGQKNKDRFSPNRGPNHGLLPSLSKSPKEILAMEKAARSFEPPPKMFGSKRPTQIQEAVNSGQLSHLVKGIKKERTKLSDTPRGERKKDKGKAPAETPILMVGRVYMDGGSSCEIIYESCFEKLNPTIKATKVDLKTPLVGFSGERS